VCVLRLVEQPVVRRAPRWMPRYHCRASGDVEARPLEDLGRGSVPRRDDDRAGPDRPRRPPRRLSRFRPSIRMRSTGESARSSSRPARPGVGDPRVPRCSCRRSSDSPGGTSRSAWQLPSVYDMTGSSSWPSAFHPPLDRVHARHASRCARGFRGVSRRVRSRARGRTRQTAASRPPVMALSPCHLATFLLVRPQRDLRVDRRRPAHAAPREERDHVAVGVAPKRSGHHERVVSPIASQRSKSTAVRCGPASSRRTSLPRCASSPAPPTRLRRRRPDHDHLEAVLHSDPQPGPVLAEPLTTGGANVDLRPRAGPSLPAADEVRCSTPRTPRTDECELGSQLLLAQPVRIQRVDRRERLVADGRRHGGEDRVDVDLGPTRLDPGTIASHRACQLLGPRVRRARSWSRFSPESHFAVLAYERLDLRAGQSRHVRLDREPVSGSGGRRGEGEATESSATGERLAEQRLSVELGVERSVRPELKPSRTG
jgi:hypothetical protein